MLHIYVSTLSPFAQHSGGFVHRLSPSSSMSYKSFLCSLSSAGAGEVAGCLRASMAPAADPQSVPSTHVRQSQPVVTLATGIQCLWPLRAAAL